MLLLEPHSKLAPWLANTPHDSAQAIAKWAASARRRPGIREEIEATITRGPRLDERVEVVFERLIWLASAGRA